MIHIYTSIFFYYPRVHTKKYSFFSISKRVKKHRFSFEKFCIFQTPRSHRHSHHVRPGQIDPGGHEALILNDLDSGAGVEHNDDLALIEYVGGRVDDDAGKVLELEGVAVEVDPLVVGEDVQAVAPLRVGRPQPDLDNRRIISPRCGRG